MPEGTTELTLGDLRFPTSFQEKVAVQPNGCWHWTGEIDRDGYPRFKLKGKRYLAHRYSYLTHHGYIPLKKPLDHLCHTRNISTCGGGTSCAHRRCVRPDHLEPVTSRENSRRGHSWDHMKARTHCPQGHPYSGKNLYVHPVKGGRYCRTCNREKQAARKRRRAAPVH